MILSIEYIVLVSSNDDHAIVSVLREPNVHLELVHNALYVLSSEADQPSVHTRIDVYFLAVLTVLKSVNIIPLVKYFFTSLIN